jgi:hypothetical protein
MFGLFAAEFERHALQVGLCRRFHDQVADLGRTGERDFVHIHVARDRRAGRRAITRQHVHDAVGEAGFRDQFRDAERGQRRLLSRLHHDRIAGRQRRRQLPRLHEQREIPGDDLPHHTHGFMAGVTEIIAGDRDGFSLHLVSPASIVAVAGDGKRYIGRFRDGVRLTVVERFQTREFIGMLFHQVGEPVKQFAAFRRRHAAPRRLAVKSCPRGLDRKIHIRGIGFGDIADRFAGGGIDGCEAFSGNALDPLAVDEKFRRRHRDAFFSRGRSYSCHKVKFLSPNLGCL